MRISEMTALNILICDDSGLARKQLARALPPDWAVNVHTAEHGEQGLDAILSGLGEIVFLDLTMPVMDGYEVLQILQQEGIRSKVIVVSGDIQPEAHARVMALGALDFIRKPCSPDTMRDLLINHGLYQPKPLFADISPDEEFVDGEPMTELLTQAVGAREVYQELANVAMGRAADLLARMLGAFVTLPVPNVNILEVSELHMALNSAADGSTRSAVCQGFVGAGIAGEALVLFHDASFSELAKLMHFRGELNPQIELELLMDTANVLIGAFLHSFATQLDSHFSQSHPVILGQHQPIERLIQANRQYWQRTLAIEINYKLEGHGVQCDLLLLFTEDSLPLLNNKIQHLM